MSGKSVKQIYAESTDCQFEHRELTLGPWSSYSMTNDPKHLCFVLSRYKFCAKMLEGRSSVMEVGPGDGLGLPIIAQAVGHVYAVDWDKRLLDGNARRLDHLKNVTYLHVDLNETSPDVRVDGAFMIDVIEHVEPAKEAAFMDHVVRCLRSNGVLINGTPNITGSQYASRGSQVSHINLKSMKTLRDLMERYFDNVFTFGMNDEVLHTGYPEMCHYIWAVGAGLKLVWREQPSRKRSRRTRTA